MLTIYTPTFNRKQELCRLYDSLCRQTDLCFKWLVVDDGSTDETKSLISKWILDDVIQIEYVYKENGGVHTARDLAYEMISSGLIWGVDSDDWLAEDAVCNVQKLWAQKEHTGALGIFAPVYDVDAKKNIIEYPDLESISFQDLFYKYRAKGDQTIIIRADVIRTIRKFPVYENEKLVSESYKWIQLPDKPFLILRKFTTYVEYQDSGYSKNVRSGYFKNLNGYFDLYNIHVLYAKYWMQRFEFCIKYCVAGLFLKRTNLVSLSYRPWLAMLCYPLGILMFLVVRKKWRRFR